MKALFLLTVLAGVALAHPTRDTVHIEGGCWVDEDGKSHCDNTPVSYFLFGENFTMAVR